MIQKPKRPTKPVVTKPSKPTKPVMVKEKKADRFTSTKEDTAKGTYRSDRGRKSADEIRKIMGK